MKKTANNKKDIKTKIEGLNKIGNMSPEKLKELTLEQLKKKEKSHKTLIGIFIPLIIALFFFVFRDYFKGEELDWSIMMIAICSLGGPASLYPELKQIQKEILSRGNV